MAGVIVKIGADTKELRDAVKGSRSALKSLGRQMDENITQAAKFGAAAAAAGVALGIGLTAKGLKAVDAQAKLAQSLGTTSKSMATLERAGQLTGISVEKINASATRLTRRLSLAEAGAGPAADAIERLGLSAAELSELPLDKRIATVNNAIETMIPKAERAGIATQFFGEEAGIAMRRLNSNVLRQAATEAERFGTAVSQIDAAKVEAANDAFSQIGLMLDGVQTQLAVELADSITAVSNSLAKEFGDSSDEMKEGIGNAVDAAIMGFAEVLDGAATVVDFISANPISAKFGVLGWVLLGPKGALIASAIGAVFDQIEEGLANFGVGVSEGEENARKLLNIQEQIAAAQQRINVAQSIGNTEAQQEAQRELELLRQRQSELQTAVDSSSEAQARYNELLNQGTSAADGFAGGLRRTSEALRESLGGDDDEANPFAGQTPGQQEEERERNAEHQEKLIEQRKKWAERMNALDKRAAEGSVKQAEWSNKQKLDFTENTLGHLTSLMNSESRKQFEIGKAAAIGESIISTYQAATKALTLGPIAGPIAAAAITASGFAKVAAIRSQSFGGGGGTGDAGGSNTQNINAQTEQVQQRSTSVDISLIGADNRDRAVASSVIDQLNDEIERGGRISRVGLA